MVSLIILSPPPVAWFYHTLPSKVHYEYRHLIRITVYAGIIRNLIDRCAFSIHLSNGINLTLVPCKIHVLTGNVDAPAFLSQICLFNVCDSCLLRHKSIPLPPLILASSRLKNALTASLFSGAGLRHCFNLSSPSVHFNTCFETRIMITFASKGSPNLMASSYQSLTFMFHPLLYLLNALVNLFIQNPAFSVVVLRNQRV